MTTKTVIKVVSQEVRAGWVSLEQVSEVFSDQEILEMVQRYQDAQKHAVNYRVRAKVKNQLMKERLAELEGRLAAAEEEEDE